MKKSHQLRLALATSLFLACGQCAARAATTIFAQPGQQAPGTFSVVGEEEGVAGLIYTPGSIWKRDTLLGDMNDFRNQLLYRGFSFAPTYIAEVFGNVAGGIKRGAISDGVFNLAADVDLERVTGFWKNATFHTNFLWIYGRSLSEHYVGDFSNTSNISGFNTFRVQEMWLEQSFWNRRVTLRLGLLAADAEFFASNYSSLFINGTFGAFTLVGANLPNPPIYPMAAPAIRLFVQPVSKFYAQVGAYYGNTGAQDENTTGFNFDFNADNGALIFSEVGFLLNQSPNDRGLVGTYKIGSFVHTGQFSTWNSQAEDALGTGGLNDVGANYGFYGVIDQEIYKAGGRTVGLFVRGGFAPGNINFVNGYIDCGFNFIGFIPGRFRDVAGIAFAHSFVSKDFSDADQLQGNPASYGESVLEATYKIAVTPWWSIQPDLQWIINPSGVSGSPNALVLGLRISVAF